MRMFSAVSLGLTGLALVPPLLSLARESDQTQTAKEFRAYLDGDWKLWMVQYPEMATGVGYPGLNSRWSDDSPHGIAARKAHLERLKKLKSFSPEGLPASEKLNYDLYRELLETAEEGLQYGDENGALPLSVLEPRVRQWIAAQVGQ